MIHPSDPLGDSYRPARVNAERLRCSICGRPFAAGFVPAPTIGGPHDGALVCRDCRRQLELEATRPADRPGLF